MGRIHQMGEQLATLIAAGEVVTGPASVVRELLDNALDAGAATIDVTIEEGGLHSIRVADDGCGMDAEDALLCVSRHATSKIRGVGDLEALRTLGFRGEALAAILSVSRLRIDTRAEGSEVGRSVTGAGGAVEEVRAVARRPGTTVEVSRLFFNTPARREFLDTPRAEASRVLQVVQRAALVNPPVRVSLREGRRTLLELPPAEDLLERIRQVFGSEFADALLPVAASRGEVSVTGFVAHPAAAVKRARRNTFAVNGRPVESFEIRRLLSTTFAPLLHGGAHVEAVLRVHLPARDVDANVSPEKSQVRFRRPGQVFATVSDALRGALGEEASLVRLAAGGEVPLAREAPRASAPVPPSSLPLRLRHGLPTRPRSLLQLADTFLLCPTEGGLLIVDQHSAHERVHYERLRERFRRLGRNQEVQSLIFPEALELDAGQAALVEEMGGFLRRLGFDLVPGAPRSYFVQAVPAVLGAPSAWPALRALLDAYAEDRSSGLRTGEIEEGVTPLEDRLLKTLACHAAVKAGQPLAEEEIRALWSALIQVELAGHDVHGRPAILFLESAEIARRMGRTAFER